MEALTAVVLTVFIAIAANWYMALAAPLAQ